MMLSSRDEQRREHIEAVELHRIPPAVWSGTIVESTRAWMEAMEKARP